MHLRVKAARFRFWGTRFLTHVAEVCFSSALRKTSQLFTSIHVFTGRVFLTLLIESTSTKESDRLDAGYCSPRKEWAAGRLPLNENRNSKEKIES